MKDVKKDILKFLKRGEKTASEISVSTQTNYYKIKEVLSELIGEEKIEILYFRDRKYYKLKEGK